MHAVVELLVGWVRCGRLLVAYVCCGGLFQWCGYPVTGRVLTHGGSVWVYYVPSFHFLVENIGKSKK